MLKKIIKQIIFNKNIYVIVFLSFIFNAINLFPQIKTIFGYLGISAIIYIVVSITISTIFEIDLFKILQNKDNIIIANHKIFPLLDTIKTSLQVHKDTFDFSVKSTNNKTEIVDLPPEEYKQQKINKLEEQYKYVLTALEKWKNKEIDNIINSK